MVNSYLCSRDSRIHHKTLSYDKSSEIYIKKNKEWEYETFGFDPIDAFPLAGDGPETWPRIV